MQQNQISPTARCSLMWGIKHLKLKESMVLSSLWQLMISKYVILTANYLYSIQQLDILQ